METSPNPEIILLVVVLWYNLIDIEENDLFRGYEAWIVLNEHFQSKEEEEENKKFVQILQ